MQTKILVAYATRNGSTVGVAKAIGESLAGRGYQVDVIAMQQNPSPKGYQAVILGSAVNGGQWLPGAVEYAQNHQAELNALPLALFCVHAMNLGQDEQSRSSRLAYLDNVRAVVRPAEEAFFAGVGITAQSSLIERVAGKLFKIAEGDRRDWNAIHGWGQAVFQAEGGMQ